MTERKFTKDERSLLLFFETRLVDYSGRVASIHMNEEDIKIAKKFVEENLIQFGRLKFAVVESFRGQGLTQRHTHWVRFSDAAWKIAHKLRRERSDRMIAAEEKKLESEKTGV